MRPQRFEASPRTGSGGGERARLPGGLRCIRRRDTTQIVKERLQAESCTHPQRLSRCCSDHTVASLADLTSAQTRAVPRWAPALRASPLPGAAVDTCTPIRGPTRNTSDPTKKSARLALLNRQGDRRSAALDRGLERSDANWQADLDTGRLPRRGADTVCRFFEMITPSGGEPQEISGNRSHGRVVGSRIARPPRGRNAVWRPLSITKRNRRFQAS